MLSRNNSFLSTKRYSMKSLINVCERMFSLMNKLNITRVSIEKKHEMYFLRIRQKINSMHVHSTINVNWLFYSKYLHCTNYKKDYYNANEFYIWLNLHFFFMQCLIQISKRYYHKQRQHSYKFSNSTIHWVIWLSNQIFFIVFIEFQFNWVQFLSFESMNQKTLQRNVIIFRRQFRWFFTIRDESKSM